MPNLADFGTDVTLPQLHLLGRVRAALDPSPIVPGSREKVPSPSLATFDFAKWSSNMEGRIYGIGQVAITVSDVNTALGFYRDILGLPFLFSPNPQLAFLMAGDVRVMLSTPQGAGKVGANSLLYFRTTNLETTHANIVERGAASERLPQLAARMADHELWLSFVRDPDGNLVGLMEEKR